MKPSNSNTNNQWPNYDTLYKLGGGTVANADSIRASLNSIHWTQRTCLVVSAPAGVTDLLSAAAHSFSNKEVKNAQSYLNEVINRFEHICHELFSPEQAQLFVQEWQTWLNYHAHDASPSRLQARGELWNAALIAKYLHQQGIGAEAVDARLHILAYSEQGEAEVVIQRQYWPLQNIVPVVTGYIADSIATDGSRQTTTLGRDGSDYSAALLAEALKVKQLYFYTDTHGIRSADPKLLEHAGQSISCIGHLEAKTLVHWGGGVLHERTIKPLIRSAIRACIGKPGDSKQVTHLVPQSHWPSGGIGLFIYSDKNANDARVIIPTPQNKTTLSDAQKECYALQAQQVLHEFKRLWPQADYYGGGLELAASPLDSKQAETTDPSKSTALSPQNAARYLLQHVHRQVYEQPQTIKLVLIGPGQVGGEVLRQLQNIDFAWRLEFGLAVELHQVINSQGTIEHFSPDHTEYINPKDLSLTPNSDGSPIIIVDTTAAPEVAAHHIHWLEQGAAVVTANKHGLTQVQSIFTRLHTNPKYAASTTVGAGLPFIDTLKQLRGEQRSPFSIDSILSGSINYLLTQLEQGHSYTTALTDAQEKGFLEPDPSDDLEGWDSARKLLILARTLGYQLELSDIARTPLVKDGDPTQLKQRLAQAWGENALIRYVGQIDSAGHCRLEPKVVPRSSALCVQSCHNALQIHAQNQSSTCLTGPGAGPVVTAQGVLRDILQIATQLREKYQAQSVQAA